MFCRSILVVFILQAQFALACGVCVEDKIAAVYDHAVVSLALAQKHHVAFFHVEGPLVAGDATKQRLLKIAESVADKGSARVSVESASLALAFDPQRVPVAALQKDLERRLAPMKLSLMPMQLIDRPVELKTIRR